MELINIDNTVLDKKYFKQSKKTQLIPLLSIVAISIVSLINTKLFLQDPINNYALMQDISLSFVLLLIIYLLTKVHKTNLDNWLLISAYSISAIFCVYIGIASFPSALLIVLLICALSSILLKEKNTLFIGIFFTIAIVCISFLQKYEIIKSYNNQAANNQDILEIIFYTAVSALIIFLTWQKNTEILISHNQLKNNQRELAQEKKDFELKIEKKANEALKDKKEKIKQLQILASIGHLSSGIFHDIINPLTVVNLNLEQMKNTFIPSPPETKDLIQQALKASHRIQSLIESTNNCLREQSQQQSFSIYEEVLQITKIMEAKAREEKVTIKITANEDICIKGGPTRFGQVLMNLIANAIEASKNINKEKLININIGRQKESEEIYLEISDQGVGISNENINNIFNTFFSTKKFSKHNTGIGLSVVKDIIEKDFQGKIFVSSVISQGTTFRILIPANYECY